MDLFEMLEKLTSLGGVSGDEKQVSDVAAELLQPFCDRVTVDLRGNVLGRMEGEGPLFHFDAHMDRIGLIITSVEKGGFLKFGSCGGVDGRFLPGTEVLIYGKKQISGIISSVPPHLQSEDRDKAPDIKDLSIDTGLTYEELSELVRPGDTAVFPSVPGRLLGGQITMGALDDRAGMAVLLLLAERLDSLEKRPNVLFTFTVQEEVGGRGAGTSVFDIRPDFSVAVDVTFGWTPGLKKEDTGICGKGPMIGYSPLLSRSLFRELKEISEKYGIPYGLEIMEGRTGTHGDELSVCCGGISTGIVSVPLKYMHTPSEVIEESDLLNTVSLLEAFILEKSGTEKNIEVFEKRKTESFLEIEKENGNSLYDIASISGISGREEEVSEYIIKRLPSDVTCKKDALGNLYVHKKGLKKGKNLMVEAHMDEVGLIVTSVTEEGYLKFGTVGGIDPSVLLSRPVRLESGVYGIIGIKPIHLTEREERERIPSVSSLCIDIGAESKEEALLYAEPGDFATFIPVMTRLGNGRIRMKALDDRLGCNIMLDLLSKDIPYDTEFVFTVQEEVGARGAGAAAFNISPDTAIILETTTAGDILGVEGSERACVLGEGPVISYMDRGTVYDRGLYKEAVKAAEENGIGWQTKTLIAGGNDSSAVQRAGKGTRVLAVSVPTRYLHSPSCVADESDIEETERLVSVLLETFGGNEA